MSDSIEPKENPPQLKLHYTVLTPEQRDADIWAEEILRERLPRTRQLAQNWQAIISAITALLGAGTLISADDVIRALDPPGWAVLYGVLTGLALLSAAGSILLASLAGQASWPVIPPGARERLALRETLIIRTRRLLKWSQLLAGIALILLICSFAVRWYAPEKPATKVSPTVVTIPISLQSAGRIKLQ